MCHAARLCSHSGGGEALKAFRKEARLVLETRRTFIRHGVAAGLALGPLIAIGSRSPSWASGDPFSLGVAAGSPSPDGFVLWTRLAPEPLSVDPAAAGGMSQGDVELAYEIATDDAFRTIIKHGRCIAERTFAHSVHLEVRGLDPRRPYWYRFTRGDAVSRVGHAMTAAAPGSKVDRLRFGFVSCSNYEQGHFSACRHLADESPEFFVCLGDYIYEYIDKLHPTVRRHSDNVDAATLPTYRNRYAQYRLDPDLQRLHAEAAALVTWDDHEVQNDYADRWSQNYDDTPHFLDRRAAAYQAFYEHMPVRAMSRPNGPAMRVYDRFQFGDLAEISLIDGRQYRSRQACYEERHSGKGHPESNTSCPERLAAERYLIGAEQERWLFDGLSRSNARWNVIAQDVLMAQLRQRDDKGDFAYWTDDWNGYPKDRQRVLDYLHNSRTANPVVLTGDIHSFWANDLKLDFDDPSSPIVASELIGSSISAEGRPGGFFERFLPDNPHVKFVDSAKRGYVSVDLTPEHLTARFQAVSDVKKQDATISTLKTFVVEDGRPGVQSA
jgi:alkaline phosphatase D